MISPVMTREEMARQRQSVDELLRHLDRESRRRRVKRFLVEVVVALAILGGAIALVALLTRG